MKHQSFEEVLTLVSNDIAVLLEGESGSGKTTVALQLSEELNLSFYSNSLTKQTSVGNLLGFIDIHGNYSPTQLRTAFENGGLYLLDELDAGDANTLLILNNIENGYISFPDKVINKHKDFRLVATCNPLGEHRQYTGRSKLDESTLDRFVTIHLDIDPILEKELLGAVYDDVIFLRQKAREYGVTKNLSMRSAIAYKRLRELGVSKPIGKTLFKGIEDHEHIVKDYEKNKTVALPTTVSELLLYINRRAV